ncbi:unnamed protein product [Auanema sp. JU1783]|nr:unnamed protein product [Auanema sp. JU1783]
MYGMLPYWMVSPAMTNPALLQTTATNSHSTPTSAVSPGVTARPHTEPLYDWIKNHEKDPYPTRREKEILARVCGMTARQIEHWFANARRRMKKMQNSKRLRSSTDSTLDREDESATLTSSFSSASSTEDSMLTPTSSSSLILTTVPDKQDDRTEIKKPKGIWSIINTLQ